MSDDGREEWKHQLGTMWRMASSGLDSLREVVARSSKEGRLRVDLALYQRERRDVLTEIGQTLVGLIDAGRVTVPDELREIILRLRQVEARIRTDSARVQDNAFGAPRGYEPEAGNYEPDAENPDAEAPEAENYEPTEDEAGSKRERR